MDKHLHILQHSLGVDEFGRGSMYRNHFVTGSGSIDWPLCNDLVDLGLMAVRRNHYLSGGDDCFWVTDAGKQFVAEKSPKPPKLTRGQQRYQDYLKADCFDSFREYLQFLKSQGA